MITPGQPEVGRLVERMREARPPMGAKYCRCLPRMKPPIPDFTWYSAESARSSKQFADCTNVWDTKTGGQNFTRKIIGGQSVDFM